jgi:hypothetical protein
MSTPPPDTLLDGLRERNRGHRNAGLFFLAVAAIAALFRPSALILFSPLVLVFLVRSQIPPARNRAYRMLRERPGDIVWCYLHELRQGGGVAEATLIVGSIDGKLSKLPALRRNPAPLFRAAQQLAPQATFGYDDANHAAFRKQPSLLRKAR